MLLGLVINVQGSKTISGESPAWHLDSSDVSLWLFTRTLAGSNLTIRVRLLKLHQGQVQLNDCLSSNISLISSMMDISKWMLTVIPIDENAHNMDTKSSANANICEQNVISPT